MSQEVRCETCGSGEFEPLFSQNGHELRRCRSCDLHYINPMPSYKTRMTELEEGHFAGGKSVLGANRQRFNEVRSRGQFQRYVDLAAEHSPSPGRWLDIGCGTGGLLECAAKAGYQPEGIELTAARRAHAEAVGLPVHGAPLEELALADGHFAVVSLINVFSHLTAPSATLAEIRRVLSPQGVVILATGIISTGALRRHSPSWSLGEHLYFLGDRTTSRLAEKVHMQVLEEERRHPADVYYSKDRLSLRGSSTARNLVKSVIVTVPGVLPMVQAAMRRRHHDNPVRPSVVALR